MTKLYVIKIKLESYIGFKYNSYQNSEGDLLSEIIVNKIEKDIIGPFVTGYSRFPVYSTGDSSTSQLVIRLDATARAQTHSRVLCFSVANQILFG